jgi:hypothetical protein
MKIQSNQILKSSEPIERSVSLGKCRFKKLSENACLSHTPYQGRTAFLAGASTGLTTPIVTLAARHFSAREWSTEHFNTFARKMDVLSILQTMRSSEPNDALSGPLCRRPREECRDFSCAAVSGTSTRSSTPGGRGQLRGPKAPRRPQGGAHDNPLLCTRDRSTDRSHRESLPAVIALKSRHFCGSTSRCEAVMKAIAANLKGFEPRFSWAVLTSGFTATACRDPNNPSASKLSICPSPKLPIRIWELRGYCIAVRRWWRILAARAPITV